MSTLEVLCLSQSVFATLFFTSHKNCCFFVSSESIKRSDELDKSEIIGGCETITSFALSLFEGCELLETRNERERKKGDSKVVRLLSYRESVRVDCRSFRFCCSGKLSAVLLPTQELL